MLNPFAQVQFLRSCAELNQLPADGLPELAFAGRSNAGKSSALNALCGRNQLARVSKTPGRTQLINLFGLPGGERLVDLPGYGYAAVPEPLRRSWGRLIGGYFQERTNLRGVVLIMDLRHPMTDLDLQMLGWVQGTGQPCRILLTKADKLGFGAAKQQLLVVQRALAEGGYSAQCQLFSAVSLQGLEEGREALALLLGLEPAAAPASG